MNSEIRAEPQLRNPWVQLSGSLLVLQVTTVPADAAVSPAPDTAAAAAVAVNLAMSIATSSREVAAGSSDGHGLAVVGAIELDVWLATTTCWFWMCGWLLQPAGSGCVAGYYNLLVAHTQLS
jgi:hypothetical protein